MVQGWADRTPPGFVMHVKAFGLMTRHPVKLEQLPPDLREGMPVDERGRVDRPPRELRGARLPGVPRRARAAAAGRGSSAGSCSSCRRTSCRSRRRSTTSSGRATSSAATRCWSSSATATGSRRSARAEVLAWLEERRMSYVTVDAPRCEARQRPADGGRGDGADRLRPLPRPQRRDLEQARRRRGRALRLPLRARRSSRSGSSRCASSPARAEQAYAFFNNNNQTNGVAQAPAGAELLRKLLEEHEVPAA